MDANRPQSTAKPASFSGSIIAWTVIVLVSDLPDVIWQAWTGAIPPWLFWVKVGCLFAMIMSGWAVKRLCSLRPFFILLFIIAAGRKIFNWLGMTSSYLAQAKQ